MSEPLSEREIEILCLAAEGYANGEIAARLSLSLNTVKWYNGQMYQKLAVENRTQAIQRAQTLGLLNDNKQPAPSAMPPSQLPNPLTLFIGRRNEIDVVKQLLKQHRLVTLTGPGGSGKTRLALRVAEEMGGLFREGIYFVDLAAVDEASLVINAIAHVLGVVDAVGTPLLTLTQATLHNKQLLLILDNFEHVMEAAEVVADLLTATQQLTILTTSREVLALYGEQEYAVPPLQLPDLEWFASSHPPPADLLRSEAMQLFERCAQAAVPTFRLTAENALTVASLCLRLDGLPLAIELAAAYIKFLSPQAILAQLDSMWLEMKRALRNVPARQQTLRNTIEWSYRFLGEEERQLFAQLAVFRGGCTWESITVVCTGSVMALLDALNGLVNKSLVWRRETPDHQPRFGMLEAIHQYALTKLQAQGGMEGLQGRHADYFLELAEQAAPHLIGSQQQAWVFRLEIEHANLSVALSYFLTNGDGENALRLATALHRFWEYRGYVSEGRQWLQQALAKRERTDLRVIAKALNAAGWLAYRQGDLDQAHHHFSESLNLFEQAEDKNGIADALQLLATIDANQGNYATAQQNLERSLQLSRELQYDYGIAAALYGLGGLAWDQDRFVAARDSYRESLAILQRLGHLASIAAGSLNLGNTERMLGNLQAARTYFETALEIAQSMKHLGLMGASFKNLSLLASNQQDYAQALAYGEEALRIFRVLGDKSHIAFALSNLGGVAVKFQENRQALDYWREGLQIMVEIGYKWPIFEALEDICELLAEIGQHSESAVRMLAATDRLRQEAVIPIAPYRKEKYDRAVATLRQQLGDVTFHTGWEEGKNFSLTQLIAEVKKLSLKAESS